MKISYIIPTCGADSLDETINSIKNQSQKDLKIIIIENGINLDKKYPEIHYINLKKNYGYARAINLGIIHSNSEFVSFINDDVILPENWSEILIKEFEKDKSLGACTSFIKRKDGSLQVGSIEFNNYFEAVEVPYFKEGNLLNFTAALLSMEAIKKVGLLEERYFSYYEDVDYSLRLMKNGYKLKSVKDVFAIHKESSSQNFLKKKKEFYLFRNKHYTILRNFGLKFYFKKFYKIFRGDLKILKKNPHYFFYYPLFLFYPKI